MITCALIIRAPILAFLIRMVTAAILIKIVCDRGFDSDCFAVVQPKKPNMSNLLCENPRNRDRGIRKPAPKKTKFVRRERGQNSPRLIVVSVRLWVSLSSRIDRDISTS